MSSPQHPAEPDTGSTGPNASVPRAAPPTETRRQRQRRELTEEIVGSALSHLDAGGPGQVSWRQIAREVGMNPASLYTYFASLDDLFTALITECFGQLSREVAGALELAVDEPPRARLLAAVLAYRTWAVEHPRRFNLVWTDQLIDFAAPADGPTSDAEWEIYRLLLGPLSELSTTTPERVELADLGPVPRDQLQWFIGLFASIHGLVTLEVNHHLPRHVLDVEACLVNQLEQALAHLPG